MSQIQLEIDGLGLRADASAPIDISIPLDFDGDQPSFFGAPRAAREHLRAGDWVGDTRQGGSCNVGVYRITPHCNGTHTECIGHIVNDPVTVPQVLHGGLIPATLVTIEPVACAHTDETTVPAPGPTHRMITAAALTEALTKALADAPADAGSAAHAILRKALIIRTTPNPASKRAQAYDPGAAPPFLSLEAARLLVALGTEHVLVDTPSLDRMDDEGHLSAHHEFFGLPPGARDAALARRARCTVTEMIYVPDAVPDGAYLLDLQVPPFLTDAAPCRPLLYPLTRQVHIP